MDIIDPGRRKYWGLRRLLIDGDLIAQDEREALARAKALKGGGTTRQQVEMEYASIDESAYNEVAEWRDKIRSME